MKYINIIGSIFVICFFTGCAYNACNYCKSGSETSSTSFGIQEGGATIKNDTNTTYSLNIEQQRETISCNERCNIVNKCDEYTNGDNEKYKKCIEIRSESQAFVKGKIN